ncbi:cobalt-precorrin-6A reductase [uncultured Roseovarius sp.]|uniref:cobalt-precorrin-6A reductase n=1 Tax=uncultured Roseovarius sp. TaxID=293344 RepID=UPI00262044B0|nr:cobalt-precorrin-6A reductase [uncultured Roseovarius sp.]
MTLLLLAGTGEAQQIARGLADRQVDAVVSLAGGARMATETDLSCRIGGFGGDAGFRDYLIEQKITAVLDATHPFAAGISNRTASICAEFDLPYCQVLRPAWTAQADDRWTYFEREENAALHIAPGSIVFLATGRQTLDRFANLAECTLICRQIDPPDRDFPFKNGRFLVGKPPFSVAQEKALFLELKVDWLVVKNAGGMASATKLTAARGLGIPVAMINRPRQPEARKVRTVDEAMDWIADL